MDVLTLSTAVIKRHSLFNSTHSLACEEAPAWNLEGSADELLLQIYNAFEVSRILNQGSCTTKDIALVMVKISSPCIWYYFSCPSTLTWKLYNT